MNLLHILIRLARRGLLVFCALFALLAMFGAQALPVSAATTPSLIRLINASPDVGTVDVFVDGVKFLGNARFGSVTDYLQLPSGSHKVELALIGNGVGAPVIVQELSVQAGAAYTVAAIGTKSTGFSLQVFVDDNRLVSGHATVRVYDLSPQSGALSVAAGTNTLIGPMSYRQASNYQRLAAGLYTFTFSSSQPAFTLVNQVTLKTETVTSLFVLGVLHGTPPLVVIHVQVKGLPRLLAGTGSDPNALPMPVNASAPSIALPLGVLALAGIAVAWFTRFWPSSRQKGSSRSRKLFGAALGGLLALILTLDALSFASFMTHPAPASTARLLIPAIGVNAPIESVGVQPNGAMDTPRQSPWSDVGLYAGGPHPGDRGSAVIAGHLDRPGGDPAVFSLLSALQVGDEVQFVDAHGKTLLFHVTRIELYPMQDAPVQLIFGNTTGRFLNLTTCAGDWIPNQHQRTMRLVVYTSFGPAPANASTGISSAPLTLPSSSSSSTSPTAAPSSSSHAAPPATVPSSSSSSVSSASTSTLLPAAIRSPVTVKLPGISKTVKLPGISNQAGKQVTPTPVVRTVLHSIAQSAINAVQGTAQSVVKAIQSTVQSTNNTTQSAVKTVQGTAQSAVSAVQSTTQSVTSTAQSTVKTVQSTAQSATQSVTNTAQSTANTAQSTAQSAVKTVQSTAQSAVSAVQSTTQSVTNTAQNTAKTVQSTAQSAVNTAQSTAKTVQSTAQSAVKTVQSTVQSTNNIAQSAVNTAQSTTQSVTNTAQNTAKTVQSTAQSTNNTAQGTAQSTTQSTNSTAQSTAKTVQSATQSTNNTAQSATQGTAKTGQSTAQSATQSTSNTAQSTAKTGQSTTQSTNNSTQSANHTVQQTAGGATNQIP